MIERAKITYQGTACLMSWFISPQSFADQDTLLLSAPRPLKTFCVFFPFIPLQKLVLPLFHFFNEHSRIFISIFLTLFSVGQFSVLESII